MAWYTAAALLLVVIISARAEPAKYKEYHFDQYVDHFNLVAFGNQTYKQRYLINDTWWAKGKGPIFFYSGNEGNIVDFWNNTGFLFDIAPKFEALVLFAEHRFYGDSLPFGNNSFDARHVGLLSIDQALADYAVLLSSLKVSLGASESPVISFGGSYGGMLSAYMRVKYPHLVDGAIAASAPVYLIAGFSSRDDFFADVTRVFREAAPKCEKSVRASFSDLVALAHGGGAGLKEITKKFRLCSPLKNMANFRHLLLWARNAFVNMAMMNYPYPATFGGKFPAFPVKFTCTIYANSSSPLDGLKAATDVFYNGTQDQPCYDIWQQFLECSDPTGCGTGTDGTAWDFQGCNMVLPSGTNNVTDMFPVLPFTLKDRETFCLKKWTLVPRDKWLGVDFFAPGLKGASNIVFSNGDLDPWMKGGVLKNISSSIVSVVVEGGAHHLDLRAPNAADPPSVLRVRRFEAAFVRKWVSQARRRNKAAAARF